MQSELRGPRSRSPVRLVYGVRHGPQAPTAECPRQEDGTHEVRLEHPRLGPDRASRKMQGADEAP
eukprot:14654134-Alexandrium_andersonii.AAC.1